jgi:hypothetical protein
MKIKGLVLFGILFASTWVMSLEVTVRPDNLRVKSGEAVKLDVNVKGFANGQTADVACRVGSGLDQEAANFTGKTDTAGKAQFSFTPKKEWSYGVTATAKSGADTATGSDVFTCAVNPYAVAVDYSVPEVYGQDILADGSPAPEGPVKNPQRQKDIATQVARFRAQYLTVGELMGMAYCSFSSIKPPTLNYFKGFHYNYSVNAVRQLCMHRGQTLALVFLCENPSVS